jgi:hypothetical protein
MNLSELVQHYYSRLYIRMLPWLSAILFPNLPSQEFEERQQIWSHNWRQLLFWQPDFGTLRANTFTSKYKTIYEQIQDYFVYWKSR